MNKTIEDAIPILREAGRDDLADKLARVDTLITQLSDNIGEMMINVKKQHALVVSAGTEFTRRARLVRYGSDVKTLAKDMENFYKPFAAKGDPT